MIYVALVMVVYPCEILLFNHFRHEVTDIASLASFSFGIEEDDRYVMIWKKVCSILNIPVQYASHKCINIPLCFCEREKCI